MLNSQINSKWCQSAKYQKQYEEWARLLETNKPEVWGPGRGKRMWSIVDRDHPDTELKKKWATTALMADDQAIHDMNQAFNLVSPNVITKGCAEMYGNDHKGSIETASLLVQCDRSRDAQSNLKDMLAPMLTDMTASVELKDILSHEQAICLTCDCWTLQSESGYGSHYDTPGIVTARSTAGN